MVNDNMNGGLRDKDNYVYDENIFPLSKLDDFSQALVGRSREIIDELNRRWAAMGQPVQFQILRMLNNEPPWNTGNDGGGIFRGMIMDINAELLQAENAELLQAENDRGRKSRRKKRKSAKRKSAKRKSAKRKSAKRKSAKRKTKSKRKRKRL
jgi:hypothetical protein